jgi:transposase
MSAQASVSASRRHRPRAKTTKAMPVLHPDAAGIDIGATMIYAAVPEDRDAQPVRAFGTFTEDLLACAAWLRQCGVRTVARESTGVYWIPLFQILEGQGFEVALVNARHVQNVPGKSDVADCQWLQYLHAVGLLRGSFRPPQVVCAVRTVLRHRETLLADASRYVLRMQKALTQMNVHLHHVLSDLTGKSGLAILDAVLAGERDPVRLAALRDPRIRAAEATIVKALTGDWQAEHLFVLGQALVAYRQLQALIVACDAELERLLAQGPTTATEVAAPREARRTQRRGNEVQLPERDLRTELHRLLGTDLTAVPGLQSTSVHALYAELGPDLSAFPSAKHFCSWLGLCPDNRVTGGKVQGTKTRDVRHRVARTLRLAAQALQHSETALGAFYRRMRTKLGAPKAITAAAHKLARIVYHLVTSRQAYDEGIYAREEERYRQRKEQRLRREAAQLGLALVPKVPVS